MSSLNNNKSILYFEETGRGEPIIFIHGSLSYGSETFPRQIEFFSKEYRCICIDLQCHGQSICNNYNWTIESLSEDIIRLMDSLCIEKAHLVGHSMGGDVVIYTAVKHADRLLSAVSISSAGMVNSSISEFLGKLDPETIDQERYKDFLERMQKVHGKSTQGNWQWLIRHTIWNCNHLPELSDADLSNLHVPFLLIRGKEDSMVKDHEVQRLQNLVPRFECYTLDGGHFLHADSTSSSPVNNRILKFLNSVSLIQK